LSDQAEIDDECVFQELAKIDSKLSFIAFAVQNKPIRSLERQRHSPILKETQKEQDEQTDMSTHEIEFKKRFLSDEIKKNQHEIRALNEMIEHDDDEDERARQVNIRRLEEKYKKLSLKTVLTKEAPLSSNFKIESKLNQLLKQAENVDLCFLVDCTSSMSSYIEQVQSKINKLVNELGKSFENSSLRFAFVGYRDYTEDDNDQIVTINFLDSNEIETFKLLVSGVEAFGGGDECEDVFSGLNEVTKLDWSNESRVLFHVCDAPCHGKRFHLGK
jgi:hypothetical protein